LVLAAWGVLSWHPNAATTPPLSFSLSCWCRSGDDGGGAHAGEERRLDPAVAKDDVDKRRSRRSRRS
jgi:hypothetical protein